MKNTTAFVIYNDEPPNKMNYSWTHGHSKDGYGYLPTGKTYGQSVICLTFQYDQFLEIDKQLLCYNPNIYTCSIAEIFHARLFNLQLLCSGSKLPPGPWKQHLTELYSAQEQTVLSFAKTRKDHEDIYVTWMAQKLQTDFLVESWQHMGHALFSNCSLPYHVYNIKLIQTPWNSSFSSYHDNAKWCVSQHLQDQWTCFGDLNHTAEQAKKSGGFLCIQNQYIYKAFRSLVLRYYDGHPSQAYTEIT
ncbi:Deoxyribonuclease-2-beta [Varanus komodoensis]|nr:Deoxyribonuclease-2-beta [Varanus komodoensis]